MYSQVVTSNHLWRSDSPSEDVDADLEVQNDWDFETNVPGAEYCSAEVDNSGFHHCRAFDAGVGDLLPFLAAVPVGCILVDDCSLDRKSVV